MIKRNLEVYMELVIDGETIEKAYNVEIVDDAIIAALTEGADEYKIVDVIDLGPAKRK